MRPKLLAGGVVGAVITAVCCFTPALVVLLAALGLSVWVGWLDQVLFPLLAVFGAVIVYASISTSRERAR